MSNLVLYSIPAFIVLLLLELAWLRRHPDHKVGYEVRDTFSSLTFGILNVAVAGVARFASIPFYAWLYEYRVVDVVAATGAWSWAILFVAEDHCYYWFHRLHHDIRLLWATHENHHSSQHYNLSTALRQSLLTPITGPVFWFVLPLVGFPPVMVLTAQAWSLLYQFWLHTEVIGKLPAPIEYVFNTPSHHRVHHGSNVAYLDRNHGGILIVWDRLYRSFAPEREPVVYGLTKNITTFNPLRAGFHELGAIARDVRRAPTLAAKLGYVFAPPGWSHDGSTQTARVLQARARVHETPPALAQ